MNLTLRELIQHLTLIAESNPEALDFKVYANAQKTELEYEPRAIVAVSCDVGEGQMQLELNYYF